MASAYRTISEPAVMVIVGVIPVALLAKELKAIYCRSEWQLSWQNEPRGKWTARLIDKVDPWLNRTHGEIDYFLTQVLRGGGEEDGAATLSAKPKPSGRGEHP